MLGQTLLQGSADYANRRRSQEDEARRRAERLEDVSSARQYETQNFDKVRNLQLSDEQRKRTQGLEDVKTKEAIQARFKMLDEAMRRGLLNAASIGNQQAEDEAIKAVAGILSKEAEFDAGQRPNAQAKLAELGQAERGITEKMAALEARLSSSPTINPQEVQAVAVQMATVANGGKTPSREQIMAAMGDAQAQAKERVLMQWMQDKQDAQVQYQILSSQLNTIRQQQANLSSTFKVAPGVSPLQDVAPAPVAAPAARGGSPLGGFIDELNARIPKNSPAPSSNLNIQDVNTAIRSAPAASVPLLKQTRTSLLADEIGKFDDPLLQTESQLADVNSKIERVQAGINPLQNVTPGAIPAPDNPQLAGEYMTRLLQQQAALQRKRQEQQAARTAGKSSLLSGLQINTPTQSAPVFQPSPGSVLSDPFSGM